MEGDIMIFEKKEREPHGESSRHVDVSLSQKKRKKEKEKTLM
jgi:hypothetical protein